MTNILGIVSFMILLIFSLLFIMYYSIKKIDVVNDNSIYILNRIEPENTAPKLTELIEYHKTHEKVKYNIESDTIDNEKNK